MKQSTKEVKTMQKKSMEATMCIPMTLAMRQEIEAVAAREGAPMAWVVRRLLVAGFEAMQYRQAVGGAR